MHCPWNNYIQGQDWDYYSETEGDCHICKQRCNNDDNCGAIECGDYYCSWWQNEKCEVGEDINSGLFTCRLPPKGIFR